MTHPNPSVQHEIDLDALELVARAATQQEWTWDKLTIEDDGYVHVPECSYLGDTAICLSNVYEGAGRDCAFIAAANPAAILSVITLCREALARAEKAEARIREVQDYDRLG